MVNGQAVSDVLFADGVDESVGVLINDGVWKVEEGNLRTSSPVWWESGEGARREVMAGIVAGCLCVIRSSEKER